MKTIDKVIEAYKETLNPSSKWYEDDLNDFKCRISHKTESELMQQLANILAVSGKDKRVNSIVNNEINRMSRGGMFNVNTMKPINGLD